MVGTMQFMLAMELNKKNDLQSLEYFYKAACSLEEGIKEIEEESIRRRNLLEKLLTCYQKLSVDSLLPFEFRNSLLPYDWTHYIQETARVAKELERYQK